MLANNETGVVQPVARGRPARPREGRASTATRCRPRDRSAVDVRALDVDLLTLSAHKLYGPKGVGCLYVRRGTPMAPLVRGGGQERNRRAGTENVAGIVGFGAAAALALESLQADAARHRAARSARGEPARVPGARRNGEGIRLPNTTNLSFARVEAETLLMALDLEGIAVSTGAACAAGGVEPSHVLRAMGLPPERVQSSLRLSLGRSTTEADIDHAADVITAVVERLRSSHPAQPGVPLGGARWSQQRAARGSSGGRSRGSRQPGGVRGAEPHRLRESWAQAKPYRLDGPLIVG